MTVLSSCHGAFRSRSVNLQSVARALKVPVRELFPEDWFKGAGMNSGPSRNHSRSWSKSSLGLSTALGFVLTRTSKAYLWKVPRFMVLVAFRRLVSLEITAREKQLDRRKSVPVLSE
jgi:hypothetical protein